MKHMESTGVWAGSLERMRRQRPTRSRSTSSRRLWTSRRQPTTTGPRTRLRFGSRTSRGTLTGCGLWRATSFRRRSGRWPAALSRATFHVAVVEAVGLMHSRWPRSSLGMARLTTSSWIPAPRQVDFVDGAVAGTSAAPAAMDHEGEDLRLPPPAKGATLKAWFNTWCRAGSEAFTGRRSAASASIADPSEDLVVEEADEDPPRRAEATKARGLKLRAKHASWRCPECGWDTGRTRLWAQKKAAHIANHHPDIRQELNVRQAVIQMVPYSAEACCWKCPVPGCNLGLPLVESNTDARLRARRAHAAQDHPDQPIKLFLLKTGSASGARKATVAKLCRRGAAHPAVQGGRGWGPRCHLRQAPSH